MPLPKGKTAFVTGVNGISGNAIVEHLIRKPAEEWELNVPLFENFLNAIDSIAGSTLERVCLQTGGKYYGVHLGPVKVPCSEEHPRYDDKGRNFYYNQEDYLMNMSAQRKWSWNVIRPNAIVGFTPGRNGMTEALTLALYLITCRETGETPRFSGNRAYWDGVDDNSYAPSLADMSVWAATAPHAAGEAFNHANGDTFFWRYLMPKLGAYWGVEIPDAVTTWTTTTTGSRALANEFRMGDWAAAGKKRVWAAVCARCGSGNPDAFDWGTWWFWDWAVGKAWPTVSSVSKARRFGWARYDDTFDAWVATFRAFENAGVLPRASEVRKGGKGGKTDGAVKARM